MMLILIKNNFINILKNLWKFTKIIRKGSESKNFSFWNVNEKEFYDTFPNLIINNNTINNNNINNNYINIGIFYNNSPNNNLKTNNLNYNHSNSVCNVINIQNKLYNNSWNNINKKMIIF